MTVSASDSHCVDDQMYRTMFDPSTQNPCTAIVEAIEVTTGSTEVPVLAESIDPDTLLQLYRDDGSESWMLSFDHAGLEITLWGTGRLHVDASSTAKPAGTGDRTVGPDTPQ
ncbi:hypothetical protein halTADL_0757 [Halohasta litchfieldiae]|uniref:Halobacterial output domain-containing protein n=1 Tax=Halohasta litchfieldiae TaxID=1073996 RepID=A0A1H6V7Z7_9EURY|nr:HalOD1 output domain-containing protein [Halohasta litchfieldiae]ATW87555.1 hypothetical protein halTADL_0757 [Halohasta litchfieldiae]SEI96810.1 hypothetical protein SAMN05444271_11413 [Halohasta litchfieldiae]